MSINGYALCNIDLLLKIMHNRIYRDWPGLDYYTVQEMNQEGKKIRYKIAEFIFKKLIQLRIIIEENNFLYIYFNGFILNQLLLNNTLWGLTYVYLLLIKISRLSLFIGDNNYTELKSNLQKTQEHITIETKIKANSYNSHILMYWCLRGLEEKKDTIITNLEFMFSPDFQFLEKKENEQIYEEIEHGIKNNSAKIEIKKKNFFLISGFIEYFLDIKPVIKILKPEIGEKTIMQLTKAENHPIKVISDDNITDIVVGTTKFSNQNSPYYLHDVVGSGHMYKPNREQAFSDRILRFDKPLNELNKKFLSELATAQKDDKKIKTFKLGEDQLKKTSGKFLEDNIPFITNVSILNEENQIVRKLRNEMENIPSLKKEPPLTIEEKLTISVEGHGMKRKQNQQELLYEIEKKYNLKNEKISALLDKAKKIHQETISNSANTFSDITE